MIMKINEDRRSDIIAAKDAWEAEYDKQQAVYDDQKRNYNKVLYDVGKELEEEIKRAIGSTTLNLRIDVRPYSGAATDSYEVHIDSNEFNKFSDNVALSWNWEVYLSSDGTIKKDSGSWSGLKATTVEQLDDLEETLRVLKVLNKLDWSSLLSSANAKRPNWNDYVTASSPSRRDRPDFETQIKQATIEDVIGKDVLIKGRGDGKNYSPNYAVWYYIIGETGKQYKVVPIGNNSINVHTAEGDLSEFIHNQEKYYDRIMKDRFLNDIMYNPDSTEFEMREF